MEAQGFTAGRAGKESSGDAMRILIIGGNGFLGANLARHYAGDAGQELTVLDVAGKSPEADFTFSSQTRFVQGSILNDELLEFLVRDTHIIFNCAAQSSHVLSISDPVLDAQVNALGHLKLLEAVRLHNPAAVVVYPSSTTVMGRQPEEMTDESFREIPQDIYSANKLAAEKYSRIYHQVHGLKVVVLRFPNLFGPFGKDRPEFGFINYFIHQARKDECIEVFGAGNQMRNVLYVEDAVSILAQAALNAKLYGRVYFASGPFHHSVSEIAYEIVEVFQSGAVVFKPWPHLRNLIDVGPQKFSSKQLTDLSGWAPRFSFREGLIRTKDFFQALKYDS